MLKQFFQSIDSFYYNQLCFQEERPLPTEFRLLDENNDGVITLKEFSTAISSTEKDCIKIFKLFDKDGKYRIM